MMTNKKIPIINIIYSNTLIETRCFLLAPTLKTERKTSLKKQ